MVQYKEAGEKMYVLRWFCFVFLNMSYSVLATTKIKKTSIMVPTQMGICSCYLLLNLYCSLEEGTRERNTERCEIYIHAREK